MVLSGDAHHTGLPPLTEDSKVENISKQDDIDWQPSPWGSPDPPGTVQVILGPHRHHTGSSALAPALASADTPAPRTKIYLGLRHCCLSVWFLQQSWDLSSVHRSPQYNFRQGSFPAIMFWWFVAISQRNVTGNTPQLKGEGGYIFYKFWQR